MVRNNSDDCNKDKQRNSEIVAYNQRSIFNAEAETKKKAYITLLPLIVAPLFIPARKLKRIGNLK